MERYKKLLMKSLAPNSLPMNWPEGLSAFLRQLFEECYDYYLAVQEGNPIDHHIVVLRNAIDIAVEENFNQSEINRLTSATLVHDIFSVEKMRVGDHDSGDYEVERKYSRAEHMFFSSIQASDILAKVNSNSYLSPTEIAWIQSVTAIHDNPSAGVPLPFHKLILAFREADRLWMISEQGFKFDLLKNLRKELTKVEQKNESTLPIPDNKIWNDFAKRECYFSKAKTNTRHWEIVRELAEKHVTHVAQRYEDEALLYPPSQRKQQQKGTLFFTMTGYYLYSEKKKSICDIFGIAADGFSTSAE